MDDQTRKLVGYGMFAFVAWMLFAPADSVVPIPTPDQVPKAVLILEEIDQRGDVDRGQLDVLLSSELDQFLDDAVGKGNWRQLDKDIDLTYEDDDRWGKMIEEAKGQTPSIVVHGKGRTVAPLPKSVEATEAFVKENT